MKGEDSPEEKGKGKAISRPFVLAARLYTAGLASLSEVGLYL